MSIFLCILKIYFPLKFKDYNQTSYFLTDSSQSNKLNLFNAAQRIVRNNRTYVTSTQITYIIYLSINFGWGFFSHNTFYDKLEDFFEII